MAAHPVPFESHNVLLPISANASCKSLRVAVGETYILDLGEIQQHVDGPVVLLVVFGLRDARPS